MELNDIFLSPAAYQIFSILGGIGITLFAVNLFLSDRWKILDRIFGGLDRSYNFHKTNGRALTVLLLLHGIYFYYIYGYGTRVLATQISTASIVILVAVVLFTIYASRKVKYEHIRLVHRLLVFSFALGILHAYMIKDDIWPMLILPALVFIAHLYRIITYEVLLLGYKYRVKSVKKIEPDVTEVIMEPKEGSKRIKYSGGQFAFYRFFQKGWRFSNEEHPFTITSADDETGEIGFSAKAIGDFTGALDELQVGTDVVIEGPFGSMQIGYAQTKNLVFVAGGIGITPFIGMIRQLDRENRDDLKVTLIYSHSYSEQVPFFEELREIAARRSWFKLVNNSTASKGRLTIGEILKLGNLTETDYFVCGPQAFIRDFTHGLKERGVPGKNLHFELFRLY